MWGWTLFTLACALGEVLGENSLVCPLEQTLFLNRATRRVSSLPCLQLSPVLCAAVDSTGTCDKSHNLPIPPNTEGPFECKDG